MLTGQICHATPLAQSKRSTISQDCVRLCELEVFKPRLLLSDFLGKMYSNMEIINRHMCQKNLKQFTSADLQTSCGSGLRRLRLDLDSILKLTRQIWGIWKLRPAYSPEMPNLGQNRWCFVPCDLAIWWMTLENNRAPLLCCFKLCATFHSHRWIQTGVADRKSPIWVKFDDF